MLESIQKVDHGIDIFALAGVGPLSQKEIDEQMELFINVPS